MLMLVGIPGSGKSTFSTALARRATAATFVAVNQDTIGKNGRRGTREQCLEKARQALRAGRCVVVDRCHCEPAQRAPFLRVAHDHGAAAHALVLALPRALCLARAAARADHEVSGPGAARVVNMMASAFAKPGGMPAAREGFSSIGVAKRAEEVESFLQMWAAYGAAGWRGPALLPGAGAALARTAEAERRAEDAKRAAKAAKAGAKPAAGKAGPPAAAAAGAAHGDATSDEGEPPHKRRRSSADGGGGGSGVGAGADQTTAAAAAAAAAGSGGGAAPASAAPARGAAADAGARGQDQAAAGTGSDAVSPVKNAFALLMAGARKAAHAPASPAAAHRAAAGGGGGGSAGGAGRAGSPASGGGAGGGGGGAGGGGGPAFLNALAAVADDPYGRGGAGQDVLFVDDAVVVIRDKYAKARTHLLVIARDAALDSVAQLTPAHLPLLARMRAVAMRFVADAQAAAAGAAAGGTAGPSGGQQQREGEQEGQEGAPPPPPVPRGWRLGFHSVPSMRRLHLHAISTDMDSPALKHKVRSVALCLIAL